MTLQRRKRAGHAMVEFALACAILIPALTASFQFGYTFYVYNLLESAVSNGGRYAMGRTYRCLAGSTDVAKIKTAIKNMTVYGSPAIGEEPKALVRGLTPAAIDVAFTLNAQQIPTAVTVSVNTFRVDAVFRTYTFTGKPKLTMPYIGRYAAEESEP